MNLKRMANLNEIKAITTAYEKRMIKKLNAYTKKYAKYKIGQKVKGMVLKHNIANCEIIDIYVNKERDIFSYTIKDGYGVTRKNISEISLNKWNPK